MSTRSSDIRHLLLFPCNRKSGIDIRNFLWGHSSVGRAPALQAGSQGFESPCLQSFAEAGRQNPTKRLPLLDGPGGQSPCLQINFRLRIADFRFTESGAQTPDEASRQSKILNAAKPRTGL